MERLAQSNVLHEDENELRPQCSPGVATFCTFADGLRGFSLSAEQI